MKTYCTQNDGNCSTCSLVNYGRDCRNNPVAPEIIDGYCSKCDIPVIYCAHRVNHHNSLAAKFNAAKLSDPNGDRFSPEEIAGFFSL